jgi:Phosphotransferase enzyme family
MGRGTVVPEEIPGASLPCIDGLVVISEIKNAILDGGSIDRYTCEQSMLPEQVTVVYIPYLDRLIDFGCLGVGDPACDLIVAWNLLSAESRDVFRAALLVDDATWARGRGWALSIGLIALPYYQNTNPVLAGIGKRAIDEVLADYKHAP